MITLNKVESHILYRCKGWFRSRDKMESLLYRDMIHLASQWTGCDSISPQDACNVMLQILGKFNLPLKVYENLILGLTSGKASQFSDQMESDPCKIFMCRVRDILSLVQVKDNNGTFWCLWNL